MKIALQKKSISDKNQKYKHIDKVNNYIRKNNYEVGNIEFILKKAGVFSEPNYKKRFSLSGSFIGKDLNELGISMSFLTQKKGRYFKKQNSTTTEFHLRGPRYILALDPHFSVIQKLAYYNEDITDAIQFLKGIKKINTKQYLEYAPILDYLKNALLTLFNAYTHKEKKLQFDLNNIQYQTTRLNFLNALEEAIYCYYLSLVNKLTETNLEMLLKAIDNDTLERISETIHSEFRNFSFSSKSVVRPEASHPLLLIGYAFKMAKKHKNCDYIFGLPSGSTEVACLVHKIIKNYFNKSSNQLCLIPISFHSIENPLDSSNPAYDKVLEIFPADDFKPKKAILIDDNSATGITLEKTKELIEKKYKNIKLHCSVVEADLIRIEINLKSQIETTYTSHQVFKDSIGILPISKIIDKKYDLKEVIEKRQLFYFYKNIKYKSIVEQIKYEVIADAIENKIEKRIKELNNSNSILVFKHTFLSNFYAVPIVYQGRLYSSVEQAYLRQKFSEEQLSKLNNKQKRELNEILKIKGIIIQLSNFSKAFNDFNYAAGILKRFSNKLKEWGLEDKNWDDKRLDLMVELLIHKYSTEGLMRALLNTGDKYLVEGNTWNDTFWGVCNGRGKNYLGRIIMNIRQKIIDGKIIAQNNS